MENPMKNSSWLILGIVALVALTGIIAITNINLSTYQYSSNSEINPSSDIKHTDLFHFQLPELSQNSLLTGYAIDSGGVSGGSAECSSNSDCSYYDCEKCSNGKCVSKCSFSQACNDGRCVAKQECSSNSDCSYSDCEQCSNGKCVSKCSFSQACNDGRCVAKQECYSNSDCSYYDCEQCSFGKCVNKCSSTQICNDGRCEAKPECYTDNDCSYYDCEKCISGRCINKCSSSQICNDGRCESKPDCYTDSDCSYYDCEKCSNGKCVGKCSSSQVCNDGRCESKPECYTDSDCSYYDCEQCSNGKCVNKCSSSQMCNDGRCESKPDCYTDNDCSYYDCEQCSNGKCVGKCSSSQVCNDGRCEAKPDCYTDSDCSYYDCEQCSSSKCVSKCSSSQICNDGRCESKPECYTDNDCSSRDCKKCISGKCINKCDSNELCSNGLCKPKPDCYTDNDCSYYDCEQCISGKCVNKCRTGFICNDGSCNLKISDWLSSVLGKLANGKRCTSNSNCASGYCGTSSSGPEKVCRNPKLENGRRCSSNQDCLSGYCGQSSTGSERVCSEPKKEIGQRCYKDSDCSSGLCGFSETSNARVCKQPKKLEGESCSSSDDCLSGLFCSSSGKCTAVTHLDVYIRTKCNSSSDCSYYDCQYCNNGYCDSKCSSTQTCNDGRCVSSGACQPNCPSDYECGNNGCGGTCGHCSQGFVCDQDHKCKKDGGRRCSQDSDCLTGYSCESYDGGSEKVCKVTTNSCSVYIDGKCADKKVYPNTGEVCDTKCELPAVCYGGECISPCKSGESYEEVVVFDDEGAFLGSRKSDNLITFAATGTKKCYECGSISPAHGSSFCLRLPIVSDGHWSIYDLSGHKIAEDNLSDTGTAIWDGHSNCGHHKGQQMGNGGYIVILYGKDASNKVITAKGTAFLDRNGEGAGYCGPIEDNGGSTSCLESTTYQCGDESKGEDVNSVYEVHKLSDCSEDRFFYEFCTFSCNDGVCEGCDVDCKAVYGPASSCVKFGGSYYCKSNSIYQCETDDDCPVQWCGSIGSLFQLHFGPYCDNGECKYSSVDTCHEGACNDAGTACSGSCEHTHCNNVCKDDKVQIVTPLPSNDCSCEIDKASLRVYDDCTSKKCKEDLESNLCTISPAGHCDPNAPVCARGIPISYKNKVCNNANNECVPNPCEGTTCTDVCGSDNKLYGQTPDPHNGCTCTKNANPKEDCTKDKCSIASDGQCQVAPGGTCSGSSCSRGSPIPKGTGKQCNSDNTACVDSGTSCSGSCKKKCVGNLLYTQTKDPNDSCKCKPDDSYTDCTATICEDSNGHCHLYESGTCDPSTNTCSKGDYTDGGVNTKCNAAGNDCEQRCSGTCSGKCIDGVHYNRIFDDNCNCKVTDDGKKDCAAEGLVCDKNLGCQDPEAPPMSIPTSIPPPTLSCNDYCKNLGNQYGTCSTYWLCIQIGKDWYHPNVKGLCTSSQCCCKRASPTSYKAKTIPKNIFASFWGKLVSV